MRLLIAACGLVFATALSGCSDQSLEIGGALELSVLTNSPVSAADSLVLEYDIVGRSLLGMIVDYGDSTVDSIPFSGAQSAAGRVAHLYSGPGDYDLTARVDDAIEGSETETLTVTINP